MNWWFTSYRAGPALGFSCAVSCRMYGCALALSLLDSRHGCSADGLAFSMSWA